MTNSDMHLRTSINGSDVTLRAATTVDYDDIVAIYKPLWCIPLHERGMLKDEELCARYNVALHFARSPIAIAAELDGHVVGACLATVYKKGKPQQNQVWQPIFKEYASKVEDRLSDGDSWLRNQYSFDGLEYEEAERIVAGGSPYAEAEANLLLIGEQLRGLGMGRRLLNAARSRMREQGCEHFFLMTDTACDYGFYDHLGMERIDTFEPASEDCDVIFAYGGTC